MSVEIKIVIRDIEKTPLGYLVTTADQGFLVYEDDGGWTICDAFHNMRTASSFIEALCLIAGNQVKH